MAGLYVYTKARLHPRKNHERQVMPVEQGDPESLCIRVRFFTGAP